MSDYNEDVKDTFDLDVGMVIGMAASSYGITPEECAEVLESAADELRSGRYDNWFGSSDTVEDKDDLD